MKSTLLGTTLATILGTGIASADVMLGAYLPGDGWSRTRISDFNNAASKDLAFVQVFSGFSYSWNHLYWQSSNIFAEGAMPLISWMPIDSSRYSTNILPEILAGSWDAYIDQWATSLKGWVESYPSNDRPVVLLRFGHEFNGTWYSYGNDPVNFQDTWQYIHDRFDTIGANQHIEWVWSANYVNVDSYNDMTLYYPGSDYVDWTSLDGYNWGTNYSWTSWKSFELIFGTAYNTLIANYPAKPVLIGEVASTEPSDYPDPAKGQYGNDNDANESKENWVTEMLDDIETTFPAIRAISLFNKNKELNWSFSEVYNTGLSEYNAGISGSYYTSDFLSTSGYGGSASLQLSPAQPNTAVAAAFEFNRQYDAANIGSLFGETHATQSASNRVAQLGTDAFRAASLEPSQPVFIEKQPQAKRLISGFAQSRRAELSSAPEMSLQQYNAERSGFASLNAARRDKLVSQKLSVLGTPVADAASGAFFIAEPGVVGSDGVKFCSTEAIDSDGDGYAVERGQTCVVSGTDADNFPSCLSDHSDTNKDGLGYERNRACRIVPACRYRNADPDGDGFGIENNQRCDTGYRLKRQVELTR